MYAGKVVEEVEARHLKEARHPYTQGLMRCLPCSPTCARCRRSTRSAWAL